VTTNSKLLVNFNSALLNMKFWARITLEPYEDDFVSLSEAATVIDAIYDIDPCNSDSALIGGEPAIEIEQEYISPLLISSFSQIQYDPCRYERNSFSYQAVVYIYRSHLRFPYKLVINDGVILRTERISKRITTIVKSDNKIIEVDYPIVGNIEFSETIVEINGTQLLLEQDVLFTSISYDTEYDKVTLQINGSQTEAIEGTCILFYKGLAYLQSISIPTEDTAAIGILGCTSSSSSSDDNIQDERETGPCYQRYIFNQICNCSGTVKDTYSTVVEVTCPDSPATPHSDTEAGASNFWWEARHINRYVNCPEDEIWDGHDSEFYLDKCCTIPSFSLPSCQHRTASWPGGRGIINGSDYYYNNALHGEQVVLVPVGPEDGICGVIERIQEVNQRNCCDDLDYIDIVYDDENSAEVISDNSIGSVFWTGGKVPFTVKLNGSGFYLDSHHTKTTMEIFTNSARIYTEDACGSCSIHIEDGCSVGSGVVRSTEGNWVYNTIYDMLIEPDAVQIQQGEYFSNNGVVAYPDGGTRLHQGIYTYSHAYSVLGSCGPECSQNYNNYNFNVHPCERGNDFAWNISGRISYHNPYALSYEDDCAYTLSATCLGVTPECNPECVCGVRVQFKNYSNKIYEYKWRC